VLIHHGDGSWKPDCHENAAWYWSLVEEDALERKYLWNEERVVPGQPTIHAVVFIETKDGKRSAKPLEVSIEAAAVSEATPPWLTNLTRSQGRSHESGIRNEAAERVVVTETSDSQEKRPKYPPGVVVVEA
jgi:hypothetical protein